MTFVLDKPVPLTLQCAQELAGVWSKVRQRSGGSGVGLEMLHI